MEEISVCRDGTLTKVVANLARLVLMNRIAGLYICGGVCTMQRLPKGGVLSVGYVKISPRLFWAGRRYVSNMRTLLRICGGRETLNCNIRQFMLQGF